MQISLVRLQYQAFHVVYPIWANGKHGVTASFFFLSQENPQ